jgi:hypothetical protein
MVEVRQQAEKLQKAEKLQVTQNGKPVDAREASGPIRFSLASEKS